MKIALRNYKDRISLVDVPDNTTEIAVIDISGDQIMVYPVFYDTGYENRINDCFNGHKIFRVTELEDHEIQSEKCLLVPEI